jgi:hypothetical protein
MKLHTQTRLSTEKQTGNCFPTVLACLLDMDSPEDCLQIQEHYEEEDWSEVLKEYLNKKGYYLHDIEDHLYDDRYYLVTGKSPRNIWHICIYQNGKLFHDPHPSRAGLISDYSFMILEKYPETEIEKIF